MKKFYKLVDVHQNDAVYEVRLDGRVVKTPLKETLAVPTSALAEAIAQEWSEQEDEIIPASMPLTQLTNTMVDKGKGADREEMNNQIVQYAGTDLVCYGVAHPKPLVEKQQQHWAPLLEWLKAEYNVELKTTDAVQHVAQPEESIQAIIDLVQSLPAEEFVVLQQATGLTGSFVIALALVKGRLNAEQAYVAACLDDLYQIENWGTDEDAQARLENIQQELVVLETFLSLLKSS